MAATFGYSKRVVFISYAIRCLTILCIVYFIQSCEKKKEVYHKHTENTTEIYKWIKKGEKLSYAVKDDSAIFCFNKVLLLCNPKRDYANQYVYTLEKIGYIFARNGDYYGSESVVSKAFPYLKYTSRPRFSQLIYKLTADNYYGMYDYDNSLLYHEKAIKTAISQFRKAQIKCDIGFLYMQKKRYAEAIKILEPLAMKKTEDKMDSRNTELQHAFVLYDLGLCYLYIGNKEKALDALQKSLEINLTANDDSYLIGSYHALNKYYKKYNNPKLEKFYAAKGYKASKKVQSVAYQINALSHLIESEEGKDLKKHLDLYIKLTDSTMLSQKIAKNQFAIKMHDSQKDKDENLELKTQKAEKELQLQRQKNRSFISYIIISVSAATLVFVVFYITFKGKREKNDAIVQSELRITKKLHDELTNDLSQTLSFAENNDLENEQNKEKFLFNLNEIYIKTRKISKENSPVLTDEKFVFVLKEMISEYKTQNVNILLNGFDAILWNTIDKNKKIVLYRILQELFLNMKKDGSASLVSVAVKVQNKNLNITYSQNGETIKTNNMIFKKSLQNIQDRIKSVKGHVDISSSQNQGFKVFIIFPI